MKTNPNIRFFATLSLSILLCAGASAQSRRDEVRQQALDAMKRATVFMMDSVSTRGGFVWSYLPDLSRRWGEMEATPTMVWAQPPGTPSMGHLLLDVYHATGDEYYYRMAERVTNALIWGQLPSGGWNYMFDFAGEASLKKWYETIGQNGWRLEEFQHYYGNGTFDDGGTASSANLLLRMYVEKYDPRFKPALDAAIRFVIESQYPIGGWPQRYPLRYDFAREDKPDYTSCITLNDDVAEENTAFLIRCYQALGLQEVMDPIVRSMNCLRILQQGAPQAGWALQYTLDLRPAGARSYEPLGMSSSGTVSAIGKLMDYYELTGETKYLSGIPAALEFLESIRLSPADLAASGRTEAPGTILCPTFVEIGTGRPLYIHRTGSNVVNGHYYIDQEIRGTVGHYGSVRSVPIAALRERYEKLLDTPVAELTADSPLLATGLVPLDRYFTAAPRGEVTGESVRQIAGALNERGYWPVPIGSTSNPYVGPGRRDETAPGDFGPTNVGDRYDTSPYRAEEPPVGITTSSYIANMMILARFVEQQ
jgi:PelA/Pel-15E family pectate lyase